MHLFSLCIALMMTLLQSQQPSILDTFRQKCTQECVVVDYQFSAEVSGINTRGNGSVEVQGNAYHMVGNGVEIYCDGMTTWMIDESSKEVFVEAADTQTAGYLANPVILLMNLEDNVASYKVDGDKIILELSEGMVLEIEIKSMTGVPNKKSEAFRPPTKFDSSWIITDLR